MSFANGAASARRVAAADNATMNLLYYGHQRVGASGTLSGDDGVVSSGPDVGTIVGAVVGSVLGCCLIIIVFSIIIFIITAMRRRNIHVNNKTSRPAEVKTKDQEIDLIETGQQKHEEQLERPVEQPIELSHEHNVEIQDILFEDLVQETPVVVSLLEQPVEDDVAEPLIGETEQPIEEPAEEPYVEQPVEEPV
jgi:hypothetical protein